VSDRHPNEVRAGRIYRGVCMRDSSCRGFPGSALEATSGARSAAAGQGRLTFLRRAGAHWAGCEHSANIRGATVSFGRYRRRGTGWIGPGGAVVSTDRGAGRPGMDAEAGFSFARQRGDLEGDRSGVGCLPFSPDGIGPLPAF